MFIFWRKNMNQSNEQNNEQTPIVSTKDWIHMYLLMMIPIANIFIALKYIKKPNINENIRNAWTAFFNITITALTIWLVLYILAMIFAYFIIIK